MAKRIDINSFHKRFDRDETKKPRSVGTRNLRVYFLIVCEGQKTEPHYFSSFNSVLPPYTLDIETQGEGCDPLGVVDAAIELRRTSSKPLNSVWAVFDKDDFPPSRFRQAIEKADKHGIKWGKKLSESFNNTEYAKHNPCTMVFRLVDELNNPGKVLEV